MSVSTQNQNSDMSSTWDSVEELKSPVNTFIPGTNINLSRKPLVKHFRESNVIITVAFTKDRQNNMIAYGATIFKTNGKSNCMWDRRSHLNTAIERFRRFPVVVENFPNYESKEDYHNNFFRNLRKCVSRFGVQTRHIDGWYDFDMPYLIDE